MPNIKNEIDVLKDIHSQVEKLIVTLTSSLQIILSGVSFDEDSMEKIRVKILEDTVSVSELPHAKAVRLPGSPTILAST